MMSFLLQISSRAKRENKLDQQDLCGSDFFELHRCTVTQEKTVQNPVSDGHLPPVEQ